MFLQDECRCFPFSFCNYYYSFWMTTDPSLVNSRTLDKLPVHTISLILNESIGLGPVNSSNHPSNITGCENCAYIYIYLLVNDQLADIGYFKFKYHWFISTQLGLISICNTFSCSWKCIYKYMCVCDCHETLVITWSISLLSHINFRNKIFTIRSSNRRYKLIGWLVPYTGFPYYVATCNIIHYNRPAYI